ncbi:MAG: fibronectin type III domain-containing protein [Planctomycetaceae bacterium]|jgi:hypothetical protein|nr:fibronectin type III domain-containing protein [Planctomycetaceae bacterium]
MFKKFTSHHSNNNSRKAKQQKGRSLQFESLEAREMLSVNPLAPIDDLQSDIAIVAPALQFQSAEAEPEVQAAATIEIPTNWGTVSEKTMKTGTFDTGFLGASGWQRTNSITFTLDHVGDEYSYVELASNDPKATTENEFNLTESKKENQTYLMIDGDEVGRKTGVPLKISLEGYAVGQHTVTYQVRAKSPGDTQYKITINPPVAPPTITIPPASATYVKGINTESLLVGVTTNGYPSEMILYEWHQIQDGVETIIPYSSTSTTQLPDFGASINIFSGISTGTAGKTLYGCYVSNCRDSCWSDWVFSGWATIDVIDAPNIIVQPTANTTYTYGDTATTLSVTATRPGNLGTLLYQWQSSADGKNWSNIGGATGNDCQPSLASVGTMYYRCVVTNSLNGVSVSTTSEKATITVNPKPLLPPSSLSLGTVMDKSIAVSWASVANANSYILERSAPDSTSGWETIYSGANTSTTASNLTQNTTYYFHVRAIGTGYYSNSVLSYTYSARTKQSDLRDISQFVVAKAVEDNPTSPTKSIKLSWDNYVDHANASGYRVERSENGKSDWTMIFEGTELGYEDKGLTADTTFYYRVIALGTSNGKHKDSEFSSIFTVKTDLITLVTPTLTVISINPDPTSTTKYVNLSWASIANKSSYTLQYKKSSDSTWISITDITSTSYTKDSLDASTPYDFKVTAVGTDPYESSFSDQISVITDKTTLKVPGSLTIENIGDSIVTVSWMKPDNGTPDGYLFAYKDINQSSWVEVTVTETSKSVTVTPNTEYEFRVKAVAANNVESGYAHISGGTTQNPLLSASASITSNSIGVSWTSVVNSSIYILERSADGINGWTQIYSGANTNYKDDNSGNGLTANTTYYYRVKAAITSGGETDYDTKDWTTSKLEFVAPNLIKGNVTVSSIALSWNTVTGAIGYEIQRSLTEADGSWTTIYSGTNTSYEDKLLSANTTYYYLVRAKGTGSYEDYSDFSNIVAPRTDKAALAAPTNLNPSEVTANSVKLSWDAVANASEYLLVYSTDGVIWTAKLVTGTSETITELNAGVAYQFRIKAAETTSYAESWYSVTASATTLPNAPVLEAITVTSTGATLEWNRKIGLTYKLYSYTDVAGTQSETLVKNNFDFNDVLIVTQDANSVKYYRLVATNNAGRDSEKSNTIEVITNANVPTNIHSVTYDDSEFTIQWTASAGGAEKYEVKVYSDANFTTQIGEIYSTAGTSQRVTSLRERTEYFVQVTAVGKNGVSIAAAMVLAKTSPMKPTAPVISQQPQNATYKQNDSANVLSVTALAGKEDVLYYQWYRNNSTSGMQYATDSTYRPDTAYDASYYCIITSVLNGETKTTRSETATVTVIPKPKITVQPQGKTFIKDASTTALSVTATGKEGSTTHYQWYQSTPNGWKPVGTSSTYTPATSSLGTTQYYCIVWSEMNGVKSDVTESDVVSIKVATLTQEYTTGFNEAIAKSVIGKPSDPDAIKNATGKPVTVSSEYGDYDMTGWIVEKVFTNSLGLYAEGLIQDLDKDGKLDAGESSMLVFRGTDVDFSNLAKSYATVLDIIADADHRGVGYSQYIKSAQDLLAWGIEASNFAGTASTAATFTVTGFSLGGALAQWFAADLTAMNYYIDTVETFSATGISSEWANNKYKDSYNGHVLVGKVIHNITNGDLVSMAGEAFIGGNRGTVNIYNTAQTGLVGVHNDKYGSRTVSKVISSKDLSSDFFYYDGTGYLTTLKGMSVFAAAAPLLFFRCTVEGARTTIGEYASPISTMIAPSAATGSIVIPTIPLFGTGGYSIKDVEVTWDNNGNITATAGLSIPAGMTFGVSLEFVNYSPYIEKIGAYMDADSNFGIISDAKKLAQGKFKEIYGDLKAGIQLGATPLFLQHIDAAVGGIASGNLYFEGGVQLTVGRKVAGLSLVTIDGRIYVDASKFIINGQVVAINKNLFKATGELELNWKDNYLKGNLYASLAWGLATGELAFKMGDFDGSNDGIYNPTFTIVAAADMQITVPKITVLGIDIGGWRIANAAVGVYLTPYNDNDKDDYVEAVFNVDLGWLLGNRKVGVRIGGANGIEVGYDGVLIDYNTNLLGLVTKDINNLKAIAKSASPMAAATLGETDESAYPPHLLCLNWDGSNSDPFIMFKLSDGTVKTEAEMLATGKVILQEDLCTDTQRVYGVVGYLDTEIAQWEYTVTSAAAAAAYSGDGLAIAAAESNTVVTSALMEILQSNEIETAEIRGGNGFPYQFSVEVPNTSNDAKVSIFLDDDGIDDYNGILIGETTLGELSTFKWTPPEYLAPGTYRVYVVVEDNTEAIADEESGNTSGGKVPVKAYFADTITVQQRAALATPSNLRSTQSAQTTLTLAWNQVEGATEYILQRFNGSSYDTVYTGTDSQYVDNGLTADTSYSYRVQAVGSAFSIEISAKTAAKIVNGKEVTDAPVVLSTVTSNGTTNVTWTDLGSNYRYLVYKDAQLVVNLERVTSYADSNPSATTTYSVYAYNDTLKKWSWATPIVVTTTAPKIEITGHEILSDGSIKLTWSGVGTNYMVYQSGFPASGTSYLKTAQWTDTQPLVENQYQIYASYRDPADGRTKWTWSNLYFVKKSSVGAPAAPTASPSEASPLDAFWAEYDYDLIVDDEMLSAVM